MILKYGKLATLHNPVIQSPKWAPILIQGTFFQSYTVNLTSISLPSSVTFVNVPEEVDLSAAPLCRKTFPECREAWHADQKVSPCLDLANSLTISLPNITQAADSSTPLAFSLLSFCYQCFHGGSICVRPALFASAAGCSAGPAASSAPMGQRLNLFSDASSYSQVAGVNNK